MFARPLCSKLGTSPKEWDKDDAILQAHTSPVDLQEHTKPSLLINDEKTEHSTIIPLQCNQSQHMEKLVVYNEGLNHQDKDQGSQSLILSSPGSLFQKEAS